MSNVGLKAAFERMLSMKVIVLPHLKVMGAIGGADRKGASAHGPEADIASFDCLPVRGEHALRRGEGRQSL